ncbi:MAG: hypothetical protein JNM84_22135 [Planctomycetes bacterium]|nr:hypothetical protein [Planctomycetota bacterium]
MSGTGAKTAGLLALVAILFAACVRFSDLGNYSLWIDEAFSISDATSRLEVEGESAIENPISYHVVRWGIDLFGRDEWGARFLPCAIGVLSVGVFCAWLACRLGVFAALCGSVLLTISPWHHFLSQSVRYYTLNLLVCLLAGIAFEAWLRTRRAWPALLSLALIALGSQVHASSLLFVAGLGFAVALQLCFVPRTSSARFWRSPLTWVAAAALLGIAWIAYQDAAWYLEQKGRFSTPVYLGNLAFYGGPVLWIAICFAAWRALRVREPFPLFLVGVASGTLLCGGALSLLVTVNHQYVVSALPFLIAALAWLGAATWKAGARGAALALVALPAAEGLAMQALYRTSFGGFRAEWRSAAAMLLEELEPGDMVASNRATILEHYLAPNATNLRDPRRVLLLGHFNHELLLELMQHPGRVWYLVGEDGSATWDAVDRESFEWHVRTRCRHFASFPRRIGTKELGIEIWLQEPRGSR